jgi:glutathione S-transferase
LSSEQKAQALLLQRLVEDHLHFATAYLRFSQDFSWRHLQDFWRPHFLPVLGSLILKLMRKGMMKTLRTQGLGEHGVSDIVEFAKDDLTAISDSLGNKSFFLGDQPTSIDAVMYGFLIHQLWIPWECPIKEYALSLKNLTAYCERMKQKYWS